jgi:hypothetical protein
MRHAKRVLAVIRHRKALNKQLVASVPQTASITLSKNERFLAGIPRWYFVRLLTFNLTRRCI